jgi:hypothetical protein
MVVIFLFSWHLEAALRFAPVAQLVLHSRSAAVTTQMCLRSGRSAI